MRRDEDPTSKEPSQFIDISVLQEDSKLLKVARDGYTSLHVLNQKRVLASQSPWSAHTN